MEKLDIEYLQKLVYDRSKVWTTFFETYENDQTIARLDDITEDIDVNNIETHFNPTKDDDDALSDELASMEDDDDDNVQTEFFKNASNTSQFSLFLGNRAVDMSAIAKNEEEKEYVDMINKTLPILHEHKRQLHEFGFDKVLVSFKRNEIEEKFGSWLNRHNSLFGGDNTIMYEDKNKKNETGNVVAMYHKPATHKSCIEDKETDSESTDASLQSGETARYIRSSKVGSVKNSATTMIKTYRTVSRTREALREKYACETDEDDYHQFRKKLGTIECQNHYITPLGRSNKNDRLGFTTRTRRRKVLRKRISSASCSINYSSSDSEYENYRRAKRKHLLRSYCNRCNHYAATCYNTPLNVANRHSKILKTRCTTQLTSAVRNRLYYFSRSMSLSSSTSTSFSSVKEKRRNTKRNAEFANDERPCKRESECCCYNNKELCKKFKHVADTSTEEWYVDNNCTPKIQFKTLTSKTEAKSSQQTAKPSQNGVLIPVTEAKATIGKNKNKKAQETFEFDSSDSKLQMAIKASLESYKKEQKKTLKKEAKARKDGKSKPRKSNRRLFIIEENASDEPAIKTKMSSQKADSVAKKPNVIRGDLPGPATKSNETFFDPTQNQSICNSTALSSDGYAYKRQFADRAQIAKSKTDTTAENVTINLTNDSTLKAKSVAKKNTSKKISKVNDRVENCATRISVTSTTIRSPELQLSLTDEGKQTEQDDNDKTGGDQSDCAHVTSTTQIEMPITKDKKKKADKPPQQNRILEQNEELSRYCVLVYAPENRNMLPANSFTPDGYFTVTQEHLSTLIGERAASKVLKYYIGRNRFRIDSMVYYKPPNNSSLRRLSSSSESSDDLECLGLYGDLFAVTK